MAQLVSVIIPLYNCERFIREAIKSVLLQTYSSFEIIVVNDGSTDSSLSIVNSIEDDRIRIVTRRNGGLAQARNTGIQHAKGELIGFLDADDCWLPEKIAYHVDLFDKDSTIGLSFSYSRFFKENGDILPYYQISKTKNIQAADIFLKNPIGNGSTVFVRKKLIEEVCSVRKQGKNNFFNPNLRQSEDIECWLKISLDTKWKIEGIPIPLTQYRVNNLGLSSNLMKQYDAWLQTVAIIKAEYPLFVSSYLPLARSYYLRYLSRRAYASRKKGESLILFLKSVIYSPIFLIKDPMRCLVTFAAIISYFLLPSYILDLLEMYSLYVTGKQQEKRMAKRQQDYAKEYCINKDIFNFSKI